MTMSPSNEVCYFCMRDVAGHDNDDAYREQHIEWRIEVIPDYSRGRMLETADRLAMLWLC